MVSKRIIKMKSLFVHRYFPAALLLVIITIISSGKLIAQDEKFTATASPGTVSVGEQIQVTYTLNTNGKNFRAPVFYDFNVLVGPNQSTQMQFINGAVSQAISFTYILQATKEGTFKIGPAEITAGSTKLTSNPLTILVLKSSGKSQAQGGQNQKGEAPITGGKNVFIVASADKTNVYQGEAVIVSYRLYTKVTLLNYAISKLPAFNGFWSQEINMPQQLEFHTQNYDGENYKVAEIKKMVLFPQHSGTLTIDPMEGEVIARVQVKKQKSNDPFDPFSNDPFFNNPFFSNVQDVKVPLKSPTVKINVRDLPGGAPAGFSGAVGKFAYEVSLDKKQAKAHDAVTLKIKISGKGNIKLIGEPSITFPPDFETYDPKENVSVNATANGVTGTKTFEFLMIPRNAGDFRIPITPFSYFDLEKRQYQQIPAPELTLKVEKGDDHSPAVSVSGINKSDVQLLGKDIRFIKTRDPEFVRQSSPFFGSPVYYTLMLSPAFLFAGLLIVRRRQEKLSGNVVMLKSQRANKVAMKRLTNARTALLAKDRDKFLDEMFRALWGFISDKLSIPVSSLSKETASAALSGRGVSDELILQFNETIDACEYARFAGSAAESIENIYSRGIDVISKIESSIK
jgi:hypothetical protein